MRLGLCVFVLVSCVELVKDSGEEDTDVGSDVQVGDGYEAILIRSGTFTMGCTMELEEDCYFDELPSHQVTITNDFYLMKSEVTQGLYERLMGENPSGWGDCGLDCPVEQVTWFDAVNFANALSQQEGLDACCEVSGEEVSCSNVACTGWRLPTEAEWEYAARGGANFSYAGSDNPDDVAWYYDNSSWTSHPVC